MEKNRGDGDVLSEYFELQLSEVEMLSSMYPSSSEFIISLPSVPADLNRYVSGETKRVPNELDFTLNLDIPDVKEKLEVNVNLPHEYPALKPHICVRSTGLNRAQQKELNSDVNKYIKTLPGGDLCSISLIDWLMENAGNYFTSNSLASETTPVNSNDDLQTTFCRMWIYSHHIYNKFKRREIVDSGQDLNLTGFSLPGKPGFVCVEGMKKDCDEFLQHLKQMTWKKISLVKEETVKTGESSVSNLRKFEDFQEISFQVRRGPAREYHMDMGQFLKYLESHNCAYAFHDLFGLEGHTSSDK